MASSHRSERPSSVDDARVRQECLRQVAPLARSLIRTAPISVGLMLLLTRPAVAPGAVWGALVLVPSVWMVLRTPRATAPGPELERWDRWFQVYIATNMLAWASALVLLRPPTDSATVQTVQVLVLVALANSLVLMGAFVPRTFHLALGILAVATSVLLVLVGIGINRYLALVVPVYAVILVQLQQHMRAASVRSIHLALENEALVRDLGREQERLEHDASHDHLTGLFNRSAFLDIVGRRVTGSRAGYRTAVAFADLDRFKAVNDEHGHVIGDLLLVEVGRRLRAAVRAGDMVARFGGDEFTILMDDVGDSATARAAGERIVAAFDRPFVVEGLQVDVGLSVGIAVAPEASTRVDDLVRRADRAVYAAKSGGRHRVVVDGGDGGGAVPQPRRVRAVPSVPRRVAPRA
jgi:diguanylate cyclase (GGDEF)-like protein